MNGYREELCLRIRSFEGMWKLITFADSYSAGPINEGSKQWLEGTGESIGSSSRDCRDRAMDGKALPGFN